MFSLVTGLKLEKGSNYCAVGVTVCACRPNACTRGGTCLTSSCNLFSPVGDSVVCVKQHCVH